MKADSCFSCNVEYRHDQPTRGAGHFRQGCLKLFFHTPNVPALQIKDLSANAHKSDVRISLTDLKSLPPTRTSSTTITLDIGTGNLYLRFNTLDYVKQFIAEASSLLKPDSVTGTNNSSSPDKPLRRSPRLATRTFDPVADVASSYQENDAPISCDKVSTVYDENGADDYLYNPYKNEPNTSHTRSRLTRNATTSTPARPVVRADVKPKMELPRDKENQHRTPAKVSVNQRETTEKRTPLADKRESSTSVAVPSTSSPPVSLRNGGSNNFSTPNGKIPGIGNIPSMALAIHGSEVSSHKRGYDGVNSIDSKTKKPKVDDIDNDVGWKQSSRTLLAFTEKSQLKGFSNIGNTCYMNATLQALFALDPFAKELIKSNKFFDNHIPHDYLLYLPQLLRVKDSDNLAMKVDLLRSVKEAICSTARRFLGNEQHDAHEFLAQVLDQIKEETNKLANNRISDDVPPPNPIQSNFEFSVCHHRECQKCHDLSSKEEQFNHLSLILPHAWKDEDGPLSLQLLLNAFLKDERIERKCDKCGGDSAVTSHKFTKLPRILILHLKRYIYQDAPSGNLKIATTIIFPTYLSLHGLCCSDTIIQIPVLTESTKKMSVTMTPTVSTASPAAWSTSTSRLTANGAYSAERVRRQLLFDGDDEQEEQSVSEKKYTFRHVGGSYNTRSSSVLGVYAPDLDDESIQMREAMERSKRESGPPSGYEDADPEFRKQIEEAMRRSLLETSASSNIFDSLSSGSVSPGMRENVGYTDEDAEMRQNSEDGHLQPSFRLCGVVNHIGSQTSSGHYISDVYDATSSTWRSYDDKDVSETIEENVKKNGQNTGYIFFYMAKNVLDEMKNGTTAIP